MVAVGQALIDFVRTDSVSYEIPIAIPMCRSTLRAMD